MIVLKLSYEDLLFHNDGPHSHIWRRIDLVAGDHINYFSLFLIALQSLVSLILWEMGLR